MPLKVSETVRIKSVIDGDTVHLRDGRSVRLLGINARELANKKNHLKMHQPFAIEAKRMLEEMIGKKKVIVLETSTASVDRYGRLLAHVFNEKGVNLNAQLLRKGLAQLLIVPPNVEKVECYKKSRNNARLQRAGMWENTKNVEVLAKNIGVRRHKDSGFIRILGEVVDVRRTKKSVWINLRGLISLRIKRDNWKWFDETKPHNLNMKWVSANGYYHWYKGRAVLDLLHPAMLDVVENVN